MKKKTFIIKRSGEKETFSLKKLKESLKRCGASGKEIDKVIEAIKPMVYDGITTKEIYRKAFSILKKNSRTLASKYSLKNALFELGPTGYPFERLVSALLKIEGYKTEVGVTLQGKCVSHEIDVLAEKDDYVFTIECKFHSKSQFITNVRVPLYINSRFIDVQTEWNNSSKRNNYLKQGWLVTNTKFTLDAIKYAECVNLKLLSWDYPKNNGLRKNIDDFSLYPITTLTTITKSEKEQIIENGIILIKELNEAPGVLDKIGITPVRVKRILNEVKKLM
ncbi:MAG: ATPase [Bacteroidetes bacterium]|nr:MAG: ATPase [Bacteroidota bacterium]MBL1145049.1 ATPase [Bacteroidota bacterium]MCB0801653.1 restriction endonuclease [Flavobacteriales bacterium]NOG57846.1 ATPase [Bacteroidota bacterium]